MGQLPLATLRAFDRLALLRLRAEWRSDDNFKRAAVALDESPLR